MKKLIAILFLSLSFTVSAQTVLTTPTAIYNLDEVRAINYNTFSSALELTTKQGSIVIVSNGLSLYNKLIQSVGGTTGNAKYVKVDGTYLYVRPSMSINMFCNGTNTVIGWASGAAQDITDNCVLFNKIKAVSVQ